MTSSDPAAQLRALGFRASAEAINALIAHATKGKLSPAQTILELAALEKRERDNRNLTARTKAATLGPVKPLDRFDWSHPRSIDRTLYEELHDALGFLGRGENVLLRGRSRRDTPSASSRSLPLSPTCSGASPSLPSSDGFVATPTATCSSLTRSATYRAVPTPLTCFSASSASATRLAPPS
jgi:IstB-like ATP binding protein